MKSFPSLREQSLEGVILRSFQLGMEFSDFKKFSDVKTNLRIFSNKNLVLNNYTPSLFLRLRIDKPIYSPH